MATAEFDEAISAFANLSVTITDPGAFTLLERRALDVLFDHIAKENNGVLPIGTIVRAAVASGVMAHAVRYEQPKKSGPLFSLVVGARCELVASNEGTNR